MLAQRLPGILPAMSEADALEAAAIQSLTGGFRLERWGQRAYRSPHHTASAMIRNVTISIAAAISYATSTRQPATTPHTALPIATPPVTRHALAHESCVRRTIRSPAR